MKQIVRAVIGVLLAYLILVQFGWVGFLISLPLFFALPFLIHWVKDKHRKRV